MLIESVLGNLKDEEYSGYTADFFMVEWFDTFKKIHHGATGKGVKVDLRLGDWVLKHGLSQGDVLFVDEEAETVIAIDIPPCEMIIVKINPEYPEMAAKVCYEVGNKHAALFFGENNQEFVTPYNEPTMLLLGKLHGVTVEKKIKKPDFNLKISSVVHSHTH